MSNLSRRSFLKGAGCSALFGASALAGASALTGCSPKATDPQDAPVQAEAEAPAPDTASGAQSAQAAIAQAQEQLNPQTEGALGSAGACPTLFTSLAVGTHTIENRFFKPGSGTSSISGPTFGPSAYDYFGALADGGCKFFATDSIDTVDVGEVSTRKPTVRTAEGREDAKKFTDAMHEKGATVLSQISGSWSYSPSGTPLASFYENANFPRNEMTVDDIHAWQEAAIRGCTWLKEAGFDGVDINASCDHMFASFMSRFFNKREDEYGPQSFENRSRILCETIRGIREACGDDFIIEVVFSGVEENVEALGEGSECMKIEESREFAKLIEAAGADMIQVRSAFFGNHAIGFFTDLAHVPVAGHTGYGTQMDYTRVASGKVRGDMGGSCALIDVAAAIKEVVSIPVGPVGSMDPRLTPAVIEEYLSQGKIDFIAVNRALIADPSLPNKLKEGRADEITPCNKCCTCFISILPPTDPAAKTCRANPTFARLFKEDGFPEGSAIQPADTTKKVLVVGGGPAGMEAARVAAIRGHQVTLAEAKASLGGTLGFAAMVKGPHERIADYQAYLVAQMDKQGVEVLTNTQVDLAFVQDGGYEAVVVAAGGKRVTPAFADAESLVGIEEASGIAELGQTVVVLGDNVQATDLAAKLVKEGKAVHLVSEADALNYDMDHPSWPRWMNRRWCESKGMVLHFDSTVKSVKDGLCTIEHAGGFTQEIPCDSVVNTVRCEPNTELFDQLVGAGIEAYNVGDSAEPRTIAHATFTGNVAARAL